jgi:PAS domain-containing protein
MVQVLLDVVLLTGAIAALWSGVPGPAALLYVLAIANAAGLLLRRGAIVTAVAACFAYVGLLAHAFLADPTGTWASAVVLPALTAAAMLIASAWMVGAIAQRVATAEEALARRDEEVGRLEGVQRALANDLECGVLIADVTGRVRSANPAAPAHLGAFDGCRPRTRGQLAHPDARQRGAGAVSRDDRGRGRLRGVRSPRQRRLVAKAPRQADSARRHVQQSGGRAGPSPGHDPHPRARGATCRRRRRRARLAEVGRREKTSRTATA